MGWGRAFPNSRQYESESLLLTITSKRGFMEQEVGLCKQQNHLALGSAEMNVDWAHGKNAQPRTGFFGESGAGRNGPGRLKSCKRSR